MTGTSPYRNRSKSASKTEQLSLKSKRKAYKRKLTNSQPRKLTGDFSSKKKTKNIQSAWALAPCRGLETDRDKSVTTVAFASPSRQKTINNYLENDCDEMNTSRPHTCSRLIKKKTILDSMIDDLLQSTKKVDRRFTFENSELQVNENRKNKKGLQPTWREQISPRIRKKINFETDYVDGDPPKIEVHPQTHKINNGREHQANLNSTSTLDRKKDTIERLSLEINAETNLDNELFLLPSKTSDDSGTEPVDSNRAEEEKSSSADSKSTQIIKSPSQASNGRIQSTLYINRLVQDVISSADVSSRIPANCHLKNEDNHNCRDNLFSTPSTVSQSIKNRDVLKKEINDISIEYTRLRPESNVPYFEKDRRSSTGSTPRLERKLEGIEDLSILPHIEYSVLKLEASVSDLIDQVKKKDDRIGELIGIIRHQEKRIGEKKILSTEPESQVNVVSNEAETSVVSKNEAIVSKNHDTSANLNRKNSSPRSIKSRKSSNSFQKDAHIQQINYDMQKLRDDYECLKKSSFNAIQTAKHSINENCKALQHYVDEEIRVEKKDFEGSMNELCVELENLRDENLMLQQKLQKASESKWGENHVKSPISKLWKDEKSVRKIDSSSFLGSLASPIPTMQSWNEFSIRFKDAISGNINYRYSKHCSLDAYGTTMAEKLFNELCFFQPDSELDEGIESSDSEKEVFQDTRTIEISEEYE